MNWEIAYTNSFEGNLAFDYKTPEDLMRAGLPIISGRVPGNFICELKRLGFEDKASLSSLETAEKYRDTHVWYFSRFNAYDFSCLRFEDLAANAIVYVNGEKALETNCLMREYEITDFIKEGENSVVVHLLPEGGGRLRIKGDPFKLKGICGDVMVRRKRKCEIKNACVRTVGIDRDTETAKIRFTAEIDIRTDCRHELSHLRYRAAVRDEKRICQAEGEIFGDRIDCTVEVPRPKLWWPKNYGRPSLYDASITVLDGGRQLDVFDIKTGIRTVEILNGEQGFENGCLSVNGSSVFLSGASAGPSGLPESEDAETAEAAVLSACDMNCNVILYRGGYAPESFLDACDKNGITVIQVLPAAEKGFLEDPENEKRLLSEAKSQISRLRNHCGLFGLALESGDSDAGSDVFGTAAKEIAPDIPFMENPEAIGVLRVCDGFSDDDESFFGGTLSGKDDSEKIFRAVRAERIKSFFEIHRSMDKRAGGVIAFSLADSLRYASGQAADNGPLKKIAGNFIKRTLTPLCLMISNDSETGLLLKAVNDLPYGDRVTFIVKDLSEDASLVKTGISDIFAFSTNTLAELCLTPGHFYQILWTTRAGRTYTNHYYYRSGNDDFESYWTAVEKAGYEGDPGGSEQ